MWLCEIAIVSYVFKTASKVTTTKKANHWNINDWLLYFKNTSKRALILILYYVKVDTGIYFWVQFDNCYVST